MKKIALCLAVLLLLCGCGRTEPEPAATPDPEPAPVQEENSISFLAMDTYMTVRAWGADDDQLGAVRDAVYELDELLSVTAETSEIARLNAGDTVTLSEQTRTLLEKALQLCEKTDGALDISLYPVVKAWGFTTSEYRIPHETEINELLQNVGYRRIGLSGSGAILPEGMEIDLGSIAKGYAGDLIASMLREDGVTSAILDLGGNIHTVGAKPDGSPWRVGVRDPQSDGYLGVLSVEDKAVVTSGGYIRYFVGEDGETYWHIIDPATGYPAKNGLISVTIVGDEGAVCDGLSTSLFVMGLDKATDYWRQNGGFEAVFITDDGQVYVTAGLQDTYEPRGAACRVIGSKS